MLGRVKPPTKFSKSESLAGFQFIEGGCCKRGGDLFQGLQFLQKYRLKSEIFNDKNVHKQKYFSLS